MPTQPRTRAARTAWRERFRAAAISFSQVAWHEPRRGLVVTNRDGIRQLCAWDIPSGALRPLTDRPEGVLSGLLTPDGAYVYYLNDHSGDEIGHYVRVPFAGGPAEDITPQMPPYASWGIDSSLAGNRMAFMTGSADGFRLLTMRCTSDHSLSEPQTVWHSPKLAVGPALTYDGDLAILMASNRASGPQFSLAAVDLDTGAVVAELWDGPATSLELMVTARQAGDPRVLATTNRSGSETLLIWNPRTGERSDLALPGVKGAIRAFDWSQDGRLILLRGFEQAVQRLYIFDLDTGAATLLPSTGMDMSPYFAPGGEVWSHREDPVHPARLVALDPVSGAELRSVLAAGVTPPGRALHSISFPSGDGQAIQGWLGLPDGDGPFPTVIDMHGGPEAVAGQSYAPEAQSWLEHGFAWLTVNYRGSVTFGRAFQMQIWGNPGHWEVEDLVAARTYLVTQGIANADQVLLTGWSYGGYLTLQALGKYPALWAGGMAGIAIADWTVQYTESADTLRAYQRALFQGTPTEKPAQYAASSPISYVEAVQAPILIIQGRHDTRTSARPVATYVERLQASGKPVELHWFDAGHLGPFAQVEEMIGHQERMLQFAQRIVGKGEENDV